MPIMKKFASLICLLMTAVAFSGIDDKVLRFSTPGPDRYADGSRVVDGECYALVWSPKGTVFSGFNADGTAVSANDRVVLAAPLAKDGKCRDAIFQVPAAEYAELEGGEWAVCLVDTRTANGVPAGAQDGKPLRVNRWGAVESGVKVESASTRKLAAATATSNTRLMSAASGASQGACAGTLSAVPASAKIPKITAIEVQDGEVWLTVTDTEPYFSYAIISGAEPGVLKTDYYSETVDGEKDRKIAIGTLETIGRHFFKVTRVE